MKVFAIIPCFNSVDKAYLIANECLKYVDKVICVDDKCPYGTGQIIEKKIDNEKLIVIYHKNNKGVGGATKTGFKYALDKGADIVVKIDSDGQMPPYLLPKLIKPIKDGKAEFMKGNRFSSFEVASKMPFTRLIGNIALSFIAKLSTGYWELFDPTNGFLAIHTDVIKKIYLDKLDDRYFFETDLLFRCSLSDILISEITMPVVYQDEKSGIKPLKEVFNFYLRHSLVFVKRILYQYFLFDFNPGSISIVISFILGMMAIFIGCYNFIKGLITNQETEFGIQVLFLVLTIISSQFFINFIYYDSSQKPILRKFKLIRN